MCLNLFLRINFLIQEDDAAIIMDVKDHALNRDVYALMKVAH